MMTFSHQLGTAPASGWTSKRPTQYTAPIEYPCGMADLPFPAQSRSLLLVPHVLGGPESFDFGVREGANDPPLAVGILTQF